MIGLLQKNWDEHVAHAEEVARTPSFRTLRDQVLSLASPRSVDEVVDLGSGTGLLSLAVAPHSQHVWAVDISARMGDYLRTKAASQGLENIDIATASVTSLPLADGVADLVVSNYCFHHLCDADKKRALEEVMRILAPGGRLVFADMIFRVGLAAPRDRRIALGKARLLLRRGLPGLARLLRHVLRQGLGRGERPADAAWWTDALHAAGFEQIDLKLLANEAGIAIAHKRARLATGSSQSTEAWHQEPRECAAAKLGTGRGDAVAPGQYHEGPGEGAS